MVECGSIEVTEEMIDAGMHEFMEFQSSEMGPREMLKRAFVAMLFSAYPLSVAPVSTTRQNRSR